MTEALRSQRWEVTASFRMVVEADTQDDAEEQVMEHVEGASVGYGPDEMVVTVDSRLAE